MVCQSHTDSPFSSLLTGHGPDRPLRRGLHGHGSLVSPSLAIVWLFVHTVTAPLHGSVHICSALGEGSSISYFCLLVFGNLSLPSLFCFILSCLLHIHPHDILVRFVKCRSWNLWIWCPRSVGADTSPKPREKHSHGKRSHSHWGSPPQPATPATRVLRRRAAFPHIP